MAGRKMVYRFDGPAMIHETEVREVAKIAATKRRITRHFCRGLPHHAAGRDGHAAAADAIPGALSGAAVCSGVYDHAGIFARFEALAQYPCAQTAIK